jgi:hypothetical protein
LFLIDQHAVQEEIVKLLPLISEANVISEELNKYVIFEIVIIPSIVYEKGKESSIQNSQKYIKKCNNLKSISFFPKSCC